jgi:hypothetical protein
MQGSYFRAERNPMRVTGTSVSSARPAETELVLKPAGNTNWFVPPIVIPALLILLVMARVAYLALL